MGETSSFITNILLWMFLPAMISSFILNNIVFKLFYSRNNAPNKGTIKYNQLYGKIHGIVILGYFLYCIYVNISELPPNRYYEMGLNYYTADPKDIKLAYKKLSLRYHPDKNPSAEAQDAFRNIKESYEILSDSTLRGAYDVFGVSKKPTGAIIFRDYIMTGMFDFGAFYVTSFIISVIIELVFSSKKQNSASLSSNGFYWKTISFLGMATLELALTFHHGSQPHLVSLLFSWLTPREKIVVLRQSGFYFYLAASQLASIVTMQEDENGILSEGDGLKAIQILSNFLNKESLSHLKQGFQPFLKNDEDSLTLLKRRMGKAVVDMQLSELDSEFKNRLQASKN